MKEVIPDIDTWLEENRGPVVLATVVQTWGSAPRKVGAKMAFTADHSISGSVSGGCVEGAVVEAGLEVLETGRPRLLHFGVADETAWEVGLACGGIIEVFVEPLDTAAYQLLRSLILSDRAGAGITVIQGPEEMLGHKLTAERSGKPIGGLGDGLDTAALAAAQESRASQRLKLTDDVELFIDAVRPSPTLVMVGGVHIAVALTSIAKTLGYKTIVIDPRRSFGSDERFPHADKLIRAWPEKAFAEIELTTETAVAMLTHDPKIDDPALKAALNSGAFYIGALGSPKTQKTRRERLQELGFDEGQIGRIHGPIGLDINAQNPEEIALAIMAEIVRAHRRD